MSTSFKKDYINYVLHSISNSYSNKVPEQSRIKNLLDGIIQSDDLVKITFIVGKTAGLDVLFKYLLYISDKIDKSLISVTNLKGNFDYDVENLKKICEKIQQYKSPAVEKLDIPEEPAVTQKTEAPVPAVEESAETIEEAAVPEKPELTLIENRDSEAASEEVFELTDLDAADENAGNVPVEQEEEPEPGTESDGEPEESDVPGFAAKEKEPVEKTPKNGSSEQPEEEPALKIEINQPSDNESLAAEEGSVTSEAYNKFENKFFEEVKILEKLFLKVYNEAKSGKMTKVTDKLLQSFSEIIEISSELSNLTRQLSFDLTADIFLTINLFFTRAINSPEIITHDRIMLLNSSLSLVNSLIKGGNYLNYDVIVDKIEQLKKDMVKREEPVKMQQKAPEKIQEKTEDKKQGKVRRVKKQPEEILPKKDEPADEKVEQKSEVPVTPKTESMRKAVTRMPDADTVIFKMKWIVKDFEKVFLSLNKIKGEYSRFDILEKIDELNNYLRLIAKLAVSVKALDVCKLSEVSYVFLKYLKDYRMDLLDPEIQQILKYMIFTFKMLLTDRKPEDFNVLVQYLNNPVKIFTDT
jgi:hypothetical protein